MTAWLDELPRLLAIDADLAACAQELADAAAAPSALHEQHLAMVRRGREAIARLRELRPFVVGRLERARTLRARTVTACQDRWRAAREQLRDDPRFRGFDLPDLPGLVPLGRNEASGLQEFYSPDTGALEVHGLPLPERDARGRCRLGPHTGMVFVLVPGGDFEVEPGATRSLAPYLISRWEVTRAQWARLRADGRTDARELAWHDPSNDFPFVQREAGVEGSPATPPGHDLDWNDPLWLHPVQQVSYHDAVEVLGRWPLQLPTVAQWLWAANGGTAGAARLDFAWLGDEVGRYVNWRDEVFRRTDLVGRLVAPGSPGAAWDGFVFTCPVDRLEPNPFGLHSMVGNVAELCLDAFASPPPARAEGGNQLTVSAAAPTQRAVAMGFQFSRTVDFTQPDWRRALVTGQQVAVVNREATVGLRPVWRLDRR
jgi:formylglycine-generating enzyme required for sulfatase activity